MLALKYIAALSLLILAAAVSPPAIAQSNVEGQAYLKAGIKSLGEDKAEVAIKQLTSAIKSNSLSDKQIATALFQRGLAFRKSGQSARAAIDLTNSLYLKGLPSSDRSKAYLERARAYEELGLSTRASADIQAATRTRKSNPSDQGVSVASTENGDAIGSSLPAEFKTTVRKSDQKQTAALSSQQNQNNSGSSSFLPKWLSTIVNPSPKPEKKADTAPTQLANANWKTNISARKPAEPSNARSVPISGNWQTDTQTQSQPAVAKKSAPAPVNANWNTAVASQRPQTSSSQQPAASQPGNGVTNFFQNIFQGGSGQQTNPQQKEAALPSSSGWLSTTEVDTSTVSSRDYHLQLASVKSKDEVKQVWKRLNSRYGSLLGGQPRNIQRIDLAEGGTWYRVRIGPFASKDESLRLCNSLKSKGLDCLLVTN